jgi:hypothetical protein
LLFSSFSCSVISSIEHVSGVPPVTEAIEMKVGVAVAVDVEPWTLESVGHPDGHGQEEKKEDEEAEEQSESGTERSFFDSIGFLLDEDEEELVEEEDDEELDEGEFTKEEDE